MGSGIIKFPSPSTGGGGGATWGTITGSVPAQTDLYNNYLLWLTSIGNNIYDRFSGHSVQGNRNLVQGDSHTTNITSQNNSLFGSSNNLNNSDFNTVNGFFQSVTANDYSIINGQSNSLNVGSYNVVNGTSHTLTDLYYSFLNGINNRVKANFSNVNGQNNIFTNPISYVNIAGNSNSSSASVSYANVIGNSNVFSQTTNPGYTSILGNNNFSSNGNYNTIVGNNNQVQDKNGIINGDNNNIALYAYNCILNGNKINSLSGNNIVNLFNPAGLLNTTITSYGNIFNSYNSFTAQGNGCIINNTLNTPGARMNGNFSIINSDNIGLANYTKSIVNTQITNNDNASYLYTVINGYQNTTSNSIHNCVVNATNLNLNNIFTSLISEQSSTFANCNNSGFIGGVENIYSNNSICGAMASRYTTLANRTGAAVLGCVSRNSFLYDYHAYAEGLELFDNAKSLILKAPNGTRYRIQVSNAGTLTTTLI